MLAKQIQKNIEEFDKGIEKLTDLMSVLGYEERNKYLISKENWLADSVQYPESWFELDPDKICQFIEQSQLLLIDILNQFINEKSNRTIIDSAGEMSDVYIGRLGAFKEIEDYLKAEKAIIEKI